MAADEDQDLVHLARANELTSCFGLPEEDLFLLAGEDVVGGVELGREDKAFEEAFDTAVVDRYRGDVLEAWEQESGCWWRIWGVLWDYVRIRTRLCYWY